MDEDIDTTEEIDTTEAIKAYEMFYSEFLFEQVWKSLLETFVQEKGLEDEFTEWCTKEKQLAFYEKFRKGANTMIDQKIEELRKEGRKEYYFSHV